MTDVTWHVKRFTVQMNDGGKGAETVVVPHIDEPNQNGPELVAGIVEFIQRMMKAEEIRTAVENSND